MDSDNQQPLDPINLDEEVKEYGGKSYSTPVEFKDCKHTNVSYDRVKGEIRCACGLAWTGEQLGKLYDLLTKQQTK